MKFSPDVFESLQSKLKVGNRRGVHLNAIPGNSRYKFDLSRLSAIKKSLPELFVLDLLTMSNVNFNISATQIIADFLSELVRGLFGDCSNRTANY